MLKSAGAPPEVDLDLAPISAALVPDHVPLDIELSQLEYDGNTGRFNVLATVSVTGCPPLQVRLAGRIAEMVEVPVPRRRMLVGDSLEAKDFEWARMRASQTRGDIVREPGQGAGLQARRSLPPGQPVQMADIGRPTLIQKGSRVSLSFDSPGIQLSAQGIAVGAAGLAETVSVVNPGSKIVVQAVVTGPGRARVIPDSAPRAIAANQVLAP